MLNVHCSRVLHFSSWNLCVPVPQRMINRTYFLSKRPCEVISCLSFLSVFVQEHLFRSEIVPVLIVVGVCDKGRQDAAIHSSLLSLQPRRRSENMNLKTLFFGQLGSSEQSRTQLTCWCFVEQDCTLERRHESKKNCQWEEGLLNCPTLPAVWPLTHEGGLQTREFHPQRHAGVITASQISWLMSRSSCTALPVKMKLRV